MFDAVRDGDDWLRLDVIAGITTDRLRVIADEERSRKRAEEISPEAYAQADKSYRKACRIPPKGKTRRVY